MSFKISGRFSHIAKLTGKSKKQALNKKTPQLGGAPGLSLLLVSRIVPIRVWFWHLGG
jgi:hypothetical protein